MPRDLASLDPFVFFICFARSVRRLRNSPFLLRHSSRVLVSVPDEFRSNFVLEHRREAQPGKWRHFP
ncbi:hypothetical protein CDAR_72311 [Caerostris darwini]|uniref:Secreted protein n=1 Tax=Caerostris darwini TaxID=1538125 RepID=A0AAV4MMX5_9ARAC|nr:hypothetical protein CDAR_72311 [Caerostris darwini]